MDYFLILGIQTLCSVENKTEYWLIDFEEKNELPLGYSISEYESKGFMEGALIQDFLLQGKALRQKGLGNRKKSRFLYNFRGLSNLET
jgi:hypothetical protein